MLQGDPSGSFFMTVVSGRGVGVHLQASLSGCSPILDCIERPFTHLSSPSMWGQAGMEFIFRSSQKISGEIIPMVVLGTHRVEEGILDMVTTFCCIMTRQRWSHRKHSPHYASKISGTECSDGENFANSPYLPWGSSSFLYLDITNYSLGALATQFPLEWLCLQPLLPYSATQVVLQHQEEDKELKV